MKPLNTELNAIVGAMRDQRNNAFDKVAACAGEIAVLGEQLATKQALIETLQQQLSAARTAANPPTPAEESTNAPAPGG